MPSDTFGALLGAGLCFTNAGCDPSAEAFIMSQMHRVTSADTEEVPAGYACANVASGSGSASAGSRLDDFWMVERTDALGLSIEVGSFEQVLESRHYDRSFIGAEAVDRFVVTTQNGQTYAFVYWGGRSCEPCPPAPFEPLPGDPWGCGSGADAGSPIGG